MTSVIGRSRWVRIFVLGLAMVALAGVFIAAMPGPVQAQGTEAAPEAKKAVERIVDQNMVSFLITSAGWFLPLLILVSVALVALIVILAIDLRMNVAVPFNFVETFTDMVNKRQFKQAFELCRADPSFIARVLTAGLGRLQYGIEDAREACFNMVDSVRASKDNLITYLATIGTLGPMLGLVGTVWGMVEAFKQLAAGANPDSAALAGKISQALVVTLGGIGLSIPAIFCYSFFKNRITRITMDTSNLADDLLTQIYHNSRKAGMTSLHEKPEKPEK